MKSGTTTWTPDAIRRMREAAGISKPQAAASVHMTARAWQRYERGDRAIPAAVVELFCIKHQLKYPWE